MKVVIRDCFPLASILSYHLARVIFTNFEDQKLPLVNGFMSCKGFVVIAC
jgi:hypothetical protein